MGNVSSGNSHEELPKEDQLPHGIKGTILEGVTLPPEEKYETVEEMAASKRLQIGDPIEFEDPVLRHWALYAGEQDSDEAGEPPIPMVVHFFSLNGAPHEVRYDTLKTASDGKRCRIGRKDYNIVTNNCEHFMTGCRYGFFVSEQVQEAQGSFTKQFEIARHVVSTGLSTATYSIKGLFSK